MGNSFGYIIRHLAVIHPTQYKFLGHDPTWFVRCRNFGDNLDHENVMIVIAGNGNLSSSGQRSCVDAIYILSQARTHERAKTSISVITENDYN